VSRTKTQENGRFVKSGSGLVYYARGRKILGTKEANKILKAGGDSLNSRLSV